MVLARDGANLSIFRGLVGPGENFAFYSEVKGSHKMALSRGGMGFDLNINRILLAGWQLSGQQNM